MLAISIDVTKIPRDQIIPAKKPCKDGHTAQYINLILVENKDGEDAYGNAGFVAMSVSKEDRESGIKGGIIGNYKILGGSHRQNSTGQREDAHIKAKSNGYAPQHDGPDLPF
jgi:hypothetical protein